MKKAIMALVCVMLAGCEYTSPLVKTPAVALDKSMLGLWERSKSNGETERLLVLPLNKHEYLVSFPAGSKDAMFARACLWKGAEMTLVQLDWFGTAKGKLPDNNRTFQYFECTVEKDRLSVRQLNTEVVKKDIATSKGLATSIGMNKEHADLFLDPKVFKKAPQ